MDEPGSRSPPEEIEALRREVERLRVLASSDHRLLDVVLNQAPHGIIVSDVNGKLILQNRAAERIWAGSATTEGVESWRKYRAFHPDGRPFEPKDFALAKVLSTEQSVLDEERHIERFDGTRAILLASSAPIYDGQGKLDGAVSIFADITERVHSREKSERLARELGDAIRGAQLAADVGRALTGTESLPKQLGACTEAIVHHLDAAFARIWTIGDDELLHLEASSGLDSRLDGTQAPIKIGQHEIGRIAQDRAAYFTNDVQTDLRMGDVEWAKREGLVAFAGHPLLVQERLVGVVGFFSRKPIASEMIDVLASIADVIALGIERRRIETSLAQGELRERSARASLATTLRSIGEAVIATDSSAHITFMNPVAEALTGWRLPEAIGQPLAIVFRIVNEKTGQIVENPAEKVIREGVVVGLANHTILTSRDGRRIAIDDSGAPIRDDQGALTGVVLVFRDVTAKKKEELRREFLAEASHALATLLDVRETLSNLARLAVPTLADWCSVDVIVDDNPSTWQSLAVAHSDPMKVAMAEALSKKYPPDPNAPQGLPNVLRTGKSELFETISAEMVDAGARDDEHRRLIRLLRLHSAMVVPLVSRGMTLGAITFVSAESQRVFTKHDLEFAEEFARRAATALDNARLYELEQLARKNADIAARAKDDFLATVSHELRTPLNVMLGWTRLLRAGELSEEQHSRALETIERNAVTQAQVIEDLLDVSRIISGKLRLDVQSVELAHIVEQAMDALKLASEAKGIRLLSTLDPNAGPIMGDAHRLQQVIWNLLSNAIKFTPKNGRIHVTLERVDSSLRVMVSDSGMGIRAEFLPYVFDRFKQADGATTRAYGGLGLGLAISRHIVELHGGTISVRSKGEGQGSTFSVLLPVSPIRREVRATSSRLSSIPSSPSFATRPELDGLRVLVVDDEEDARDLLRAVLEQCGVVVFLAESVEKALQSIDRDHPDVLISDIGMPGEDGYSLIKKIRARGKDHGGDIPAAALTAYARAEDRRKALDAGFMMHVPKPVEPAELVAVIANLTRFGVRRV